MKVYFRELTDEDIPAIKDISKDIWDGEDYIPHVIDEWLHDENCMNYGTFRDKNKTELIGFGRVKLYNKDIAWLEGGRIKVSYQGQGIGKLQLGYAVEYAAKSGVKVAQYDTGSDNIASISLAKFYGLGLFDQGIGAPGNRSPLNVCQDGERDPRARLRVPPGQGTHPHRTGIRRLRYAGRRLPRPVRLCVHSPDGRTPGRHCQRPDETGGNAKPILGWL